MQKETHVDRDNKYIPKRVGFVPDILVNVAGSSYEGRQVPISEAKKWCTPEETPPCFIELEPGNPHDKNAVGVWVGTTLQKDDDDSEPEWVYHQVGYLPRGYKIPFRSEDGIVPGLDHPTRKPVYELLREDPNSVRVGVEGIYGNPDVKKPLLGVRIGLRHN